jgi:hypothetical protein
MVPLIFVRLQTINLHVYIYTLYIIYSIYTLHRHILQYKCSICDLYVFYICSIYVLYMFYIWSICSISVLYMFYICSIYTLLYIYIYVYIAHRWSPTPTQSGGAGMTLWTHTHLAAGQGGLYHPVSICVLYIHHPSIQKIDPSESDMLIYIIHPKTEIFELCIHHPSIQISHFPMADLFLSGHNWASAPTPARGRELRRPGATDISMCFNVYSIILYIKIYFIDSDWTMAIHRPKMT